MLLHTLAPPSTLIHPSAWMVNSRKLRCIALFQHLWGSLAEVSCLPVISDFPDYLVIPNGGRICRAWGFPADRREFRVTFRPGSKRASV